MRVVYDSLGKTWKGLSGDLPEIQASYIEGDYYFWVAKRNWLMRFFGNWKSIDQALGSILSADGEVLADIPQFRPPGFDGTARSYKSRLGWVQSETDGALNLVIECPEVGSFRARFDLDEGKYEFLGYDAR